MKKLLFIACLLLATNAVFSQIYKGQLLVGGDASFSTSKTGDNKNTVFMLNPDVGYFFMNNFAGGLRANISSDKEEYGNTSSTYTTSAFGPFVRYYFLPAVQKTNIFADVTYLFGSHKSKSGSNSVTTNVNGFGVSAGPAFFLSPNVALEVTLGYNSMNVENMSDNTNTFTVGAGFQIHLGGAKK